MKGRIALALAVAFSSLFVGNILADDEQSFDCSGSCPGSARCSGSFYEEVALCQLQCYNLKGSSGNEIVKSGFADCQKEAF